MTLEPTNTNLYKQTTSKILVCVYTCANDDHLLEDFYKSPVMSFLKSRPKTQIVEVRANPDLKKDTFDGKSITLNTEEHYRNLPRKTFMMIKHVVSKFEFDYLIKIDVTTLTKCLTDKILTGGTLISENKILAMLSDQEFYKDYSGYVSLNARRKGAENWAEKKNITIDYDRVFIEDSLPPFFSGKLWLISQNFAGYINNHGDRAERDFSQYFPAEDVMIGHLHENYKSRPGARLWSTIEKFAYHFRLIFSNR